MARPRDISSAAETAREWPTTASEVRTGDVRAASLPRGTTVHRYVLLDEVGSGAMGVVYAAYDYGLDRKVALKLVRHPGRSAQRVRLLREAQALAQLSHPNVVTVFDVGSYRDQVFVAMEFVAGQTLRSWLAEAPRSWREIVIVFQRAGEGLAAAHAAGIVHRDFKPDNVLIDQHGRVRVGDFGLAVIDRGESSGEHLQARIGALGSGARPLPDDPGDRTEQDLRGCHDNDDDDAPTDRASLTRSGMAVGTPAYMSPEQRSGYLPVDARSDQFSFCVSLHEALCGERPFDESATDVVERIARGDVRDVPRDRAIPAWLRRILRRGLSCEPGHRYPSMDALLAEIDREMGARRRRLTVAALSATSAALLGAIALLIGSGVLSRDEQSPCEGAADQLDGVWNPRRKQAIRGAFRDAGGPAAGVTATQVEAAIDRYARSWRAMRVESCEATHVRGEQSAALLDLKSECLEHRLAELRALTDLFMAGDPRMVPHAVPAVTSLEPVEQCGNSAALREMSPPGGAAARARVRWLRARLARGRALLWAGVLDDGLDVARTASADARELEYRPVEAESLHLLGSLQRAGGMAGAAEETLFAAAGAAESGRHGHAAADAWLELSRLVGESGDRRSQAHRLARLARGAIERLGGDARREGNIEDWTGELYLAEGRMEAARDHLERGLALRLRALGGSHLMVAEIAAAHGPARARPRRSGNRARSLPRGARDRPGPAGRRAHAPGPAARRRGRRAARDGAPRRGGGRPRARPGADRAQRRPGTDRELSRAHRKGSPGRRPAGAGHRAARARAGVARAHGRRSGRARLRALPAGPGAAARRPAARACAAAPARRAYRLRRGG